MDITSQIHLPSLRELLTYRLHELQGEVHAAEQGRRANAQSADTNEVADRKDEAAQWLFSEVGEAEEQRDFEEMARVQRALQRLDDGVYGDCVRCGEPLQRLQVQPAAERCAACQAAVEHVMPAGR